jgi:hypothetical protein
VNESEDLAYKGIVIDEHIAHIKEDQSLIASHPSLLIQLMFGAQDQRDIRYVGFGSTVSATPSS